MNHDVAKLEKTLAACKELLETSPYLCLCGTGLVSKDDCEWHQVVQRAADALNTLGFAPSWYPKEKQNGDTADTVEHVGNVEPQESGSFGARNTLPNCS